METTTAKDILAVIKSQKDDIARQKRALPRAINEEVLNKTEWNSLHRRQLHLEKIEEFVWKVARGEMK